VRTIPPLPCASGERSAVTRIQVRPNPYVALDRDGLELHYFGSPGFLAEDSYGSCVVITDDIEALFDAFAAGLRAAYGKLPVSGFPRITRPRRRKNNRTLVGSHLQRLNQANFHKDDLARLARLTTLPPRSPPYLVADSDLRSSQAATTTAMGTTR
jgi:hypothetical protein